MNVSIYLRSPKKEWSSLVFQCYIDDMKVQWGGGLSVPVDKWDKVKHRLRSGRDPKLVDLNTLIDREVTRAKDVFRKLSVDLERPPSHLEFKEGMKRSKQKRSVGSLSFNQWVDEYIEESRSRTNDRGEQITHRTIQKYQTVKLQLTEFSEKIIGRHLTFDDWDESLLSRYIQFRAKQGIGINTIGKDIAVIKLWLKRSFSSGIHDNRSFMERYFVPRKKPTRKVHLTVEDLAKFERFEFETKMSSNVRDLFVVACWTGMRISDLKRFPSIVRDHFDKQGVVPDEVTFIQSKTGERVSMKLLDPVIRIITKHNGQLPRVYSEPVMNREIKKALRKSGIDYVVEITSTDVFDTRPKRVPICDLVTMHTARRSFATNLWNHGGVSARELMTLTGHTSEGALLSYLNISREETARLTSDRLRGKF